MTPEALICQPAFARKTVIVQYTVLIKNPNFSKGIQFTITIYQVLDEMIYVDECLYCNHFDQNL